MQITFPNPKKETKKKELFIANRGYYPVETTSNSGITYITNHVVTVDSSDLKLAYGNFVKYDALNTNSIKIKVAVKYNGLLIPVLFNGIREATLEPGALLKSDAIGLDLLKGEQLEVRSYATCDTGGKIPVGNKMHVSRNDATFTGDATNTVTITSTPFTGKGYGPLMLIGNLGESNNHEAFALIGSSSIEGYNDDVELYGGYSVRALADDYGWVNVGQGSDRLGSFLEPNKKLFRMQTLNYATHVWLYQGSNDIADGKSLEYMQSETLKLWRYCKTRGVKVYQMTMMPRVTKSGGQQIVPAEKEIIRVAYNDWIRSMPDNSILDGVIDVADVVETSRNSGLWIESYYQDGIHANQAGHAAIATFINNRYLNK